MLEVNEIYKNNAGRDVKIVSKIPTKHYGFLFEGVSLDEEDEGASYLFDQEGNWFDSNEPNDSYHIAGDHFEPVNPKVGQTYLNRGYMDTLITNEIETTLFGKLFEGIIDDEDHQNSFYLFDDEGYVYESYSDDHYALEGTS